MMLQLGYLGLTLAVILLVIYFGFHAINKTFEGSERRKKKTVLVVGIVIWQMYLAIIGSTDFILSYSFPPRFALTMILPAFIFTGVFVFRNKNEQWLLNLPTKQIFIFQSFRILVESLFVASVAAGILHKEASIEGYNYDMIYAITIPIVSLIAFRSSSTNLKLIRILELPGPVSISHCHFRFHDFYLQTGPVWSIRTAASLTGYYLSIWTGSGMSYAYSSFHACAFYSTFE